MGIMSKLSTIGGPPSLVLLCSPETDINIASNPTFNWVFCKKLDRQRPTSIVVHVKYSNATSRMYISCGRSTM